ncbi:uncharacterized protein [Blastocystis hominis]|uniref:Cytidyltransferase-like domain-containing protein n=1 Tax=Blastocystis hominis TaxID=12968 RepID=D8M6H9_BLAHO|nr:uncharacterized protein [Blastocystis hominis]CBK23732.2 unnamed protein product [Blastocystis hominis]|eukprot:XP_012897780.1 uncharacterized protein [Blastocystis hominis]
MACMGGTFDCLHPGHRILLTLASLVCDKLIIGLTTDSMLQSKEKHEFIQSYEERKALVLDFLHTISPHLEVDISPLTDIYGPSVVKPDLEAIVVSLETLPGAKLINRVREEKGMRPLKILTVNRGSKYPLSSSFIRQYLHPCFNRMKMQEMMIDKVKKQAEATIVDIKDISYDAGFLLEMLVVSPKFRGMKLIQQHRLMNKILSDELSILHGITFKCMTPEQYEAQKQEK